MNLGMEKRGICTKTETLDSRRLLLTYRLPLNEIITDFNDKLNRSHGATARSIMSLMVMKKATLLN